MLQLIKGQNASKKLLLRASQMSMPLSVVNSRSCEFLHLNSMSINTIKYYRGACAILIQSKTESG